MTISKRTRIVAGSVVFALLAVAPCAAQDQWFSITYGVSTPTGQTKDFTNQTSWRNVGIDYSRFIKRHLAVGLNASWTVFAERVPDATSSLPGVDINGTQVRYVNAFPLLATGRYFLNGRSSRDKLDAWVGAGAGALISENRIDVGTFSVTETKWHLAVAPEVGFAYSLHRDMSLLGQVRYTYGFKTSDIERSFFNFNVGLAWRN